MGTKTCRWWLQPVDRNGPSIFDTECGHRVGIDMSIVGETGFCGFCGNALRLREEGDNDEYPRMAHEVTTPCPTSPGPASDDPVNHPKHYTQHPSGIECIQITEHMGFNIGNAIKYLWRADLKNDAIEDMEKAIWYVKREISKRKGIM